MQCLFGRFIRRVSTFGRVLFGVARRIDYETLSRYMLHFNQMQDLPSIMHETSKCMKEILNYKLFAFVVKAGGQLDVWVDPRISEAALKQIVQDDFATDGAFNTYPMNPDYGESPGMISFQEEQMLSFALMDDGYFAKLYVLPERAMLDYHKEIIGIIVKSLGVAVSNYLNMKRLENDAAIDPMTDCYNRRAFDRMIQHNIHNAHRYNRDLSVIMLDLDRFKSVNDLYGHPAGDKVLVEVARLILSAIRKSDYAVRYGGEEFVVVLPETRLAKALELAERLRRLIESSSVQVANGRQVSVTASFGVAALSEHSDAESLFNEADTMLYRAKASGRNKVMPGMKLCLLESSQPASVAQTHRQ